MIWTEIVGGVSVRTRTEAFMTGVILKRSAMSYPHPVRR
jgi:hypothetical protein